MSLHRLAPRLGLAVGLLCVCAAHAAEPAAAHRLLRVTLDGASDQPVSGRLLVFATLAKDAQAAAKDGKDGKAGKVEEVDVSPFRPTAVAVAAQEVTALKPGASVEIDLDNIAFPSAFSALPAGEYLFQAVLDPDHSYGYGGRDGGDLLSEVTAVTPGKRKPLPTLKLSKQVPVSDDPWQVSPRAPQAIRDAIPEAKLHIADASMVSPSLSAFWGRPTSIRARVLTPPGYDAKAATRYPTVYVTHGFGGNYNRFAGSIAATWSAMAAKQMPPMIWVFLDQATPTGTHEFADSVNNGPWGTALTEELIPALERQYKMDGKASGRFLNGHSSGGWATLWLQTRYPKLFGGTWSTSPDSSDFRDFTGPDLYAPNANVYRRADGSQFPLIRDQGKVVADLETFAKLERVLGPYGGQMTSFEWVFSPRGPDGRPVPMFDRDTGTVDPAVVAYWRTHYDIAARVAAQWPTLKPDLDGKIHLIVGTADTFYLDGAAHKFQEVLDGLGAKSDFRYLEGRTHFDLYKEGDDSNALMKKIAWEMYAVARPKR
ncbi:alpha/beta hydrolase [Xanthomonas hortorum]|uniref:Enterochelin esterase n=1 Tax=Xanthomonas hortorum pv. gardneri TaxID=2754056 RepID=A0A6V7F9C4_9XANT|nr:alpha/beta hydrolase-fold protein [Xanthomonas hortorum]MCC4624418.1 enterochelin esterase [Xanthomonas campestris pv. nigromaculans]APP78791.1 enterochelin esterase [Xanthomonas hortorum pv. gardneri]EGD21243.1 enterochelin esterase-like enzyme [Xanthomonas hortorum ATCC 19865]KLA99490.1 enterochelin esterase [Xanthomonas hortorum pv. gardneri]KLB01806.1 enterochelin esterase [Xanthomonas hortorum pv. gardneri]